MQTPELPLSDRFRSVDRPPAKPIFLWACLLAMLVSGCADPPSITTRTVPKPPKDRMLAAIVPVGRDGWFFKLSGHSESVAAQESNFRKLLKSLDVVRGEPVWKTPEGWTELPGEGMRKATFKIEGDGPTLECTVIRLPDPNGDPASSEYVLANINRWRGQLGLKPLSPADLEMEIQDDDEIHSLTVAENLLPVTWVNFEGRRSAGGTPMGNAPFAGGADPPVNPHGAGPAGVGPMASSKGGRMLAAIVPVGNMGWFFKIQGDDKLVAAQEKNFSALLASLRIEADKPHWRTPKDWHELAGSGMRAATFQIGEGNSQLECSVIPLPADDPTTNDYLLANINRWRGQVGLGPIDESEFESDRGTGDSGEIRTLKIDGGVIITWVNINGGSSSTPAAPDRPAASPGPVGPPGAPGRPLPNRETRPNLGVTFEVPTGWKPAAPRTMVLVGWDVKRGKEELQIYISKLGAAGSDLVENVNRWRKQAGLGELPEGELRNTIDPIEIDGVKGHLVNIRGAKKTITGAIAVRGDTGWFFKLQGDPALAATEKKNFETWLKSIKFE